MLSSYPSRNSILLGVTFAILVGAILRLVWPADMEFKGDEIYTFERTQRIGVDEPFPWTGMSNSADVPHPGMSVWVFLGLAKLAQAQDPVRLNIACMALNVAALALLALFVARVVPAVEREPWWWAVALVAVNPLAVLFHRKIWPPSVMPILTVSLLASWWYRDRRWGAFPFGFLAIVAAQIHPGAFFFTAGMAGWALAFDRAGVRWLAGICGGLIGSITAWPWLYHLLFVAERSAAGRAHWWQPFELRFWKHWITEPFGLSVNYSLGQDFPEFLSWPLFAGRPTYLVAGLHIALIGLMAVVVGRWLLLVWRERNWSIDRSPTGFLLGAVAGGYGLLLTLTALPVYRHYMIITFPLMFVWAARCAFRGYSPVIARRLLASSWVAQALVTALFLGYVHAQDRPIRGDYGLPYRAQHKTNPSTQFAENATETGF